MSRKRARRRLEKLFPDLAAAGYSVESPKTKRYNCIAWAVGDTSQRWDPSNMPEIVPGYHWPAEASGYFEVSDLVSVFTLLNYVICADGSLETGYEKVALFKDPDPDLGWSHAARQLPDGRWTSKLGKLWDIIHHTPEAIAGSEYGEIVYYMKRSRNESEAVTARTDDENISELGF